MTLGSGRIMREEKWTLTELEFRKQNFGVEIFKNIFQLTAKIINRG